MNRSSMARPSPCSRLLNIPLEAGLQSPTWTSFGNEPSEAGQQDQPVACASVASSIRCKPSEWAISTRLWASIDQFGCSGVDPS